MNPFRYSGLPPACQRQIFLEIIWGDPLCRSALELAREFDLPNWRIVSGVLYNTIWNHLTDKPSGHGIKDIDLFYFDGSDLSYEAEDLHIEAGVEHFARLPLFVEIRNQARVHLWYKDHFGHDYPILKSAEQGIDHFASLGHCVGLKLEQTGSLDLYAPYGLDDLFTFRMAPNTRLPNAETHLKKAKRAQQNWPEVEIVPWPPNSLPQN